MSAIHGASATSVGQFSGSYQGFAVLPQGLAQVRMAWQNGRISQLEALPVDATPPGVPLAMPGFIDTHVHGGMGQDFMEGGAAAAHIAKAHARFGTTALLATTLTSPFDDLKRAFESARAAMQTPSAGAAAVLGMHLEGPYINANKLGAQPAFTRQGSAAEVDALHAIAPIRVITLAPEVEGHAELIDGLVARGFKVQLGHSTASYELAANALKRGASGVTHLFNAMSALGHRAPGLVGAALAHAQHAELIADTHHVHPGAIRVALRAIPQLFCVTDATAATGMPDGQYALGSQQVHKCLGAVRLADGTLAGSCVTMAQTYQNLVNVLGLSAIQASGLTSTRAAQYLGLTDRGQLRLGAVADLVVMGSADQPLRVVAAGCEVDLT
jgi:N-acetylglucosamine-6-phosphate deacetylase